MIGSGFIDNLDNDFCGDLFDHIDDFLDFPMEDVDGVGGFKGECDAFQGACWPPVADTLAGSTTSIFPSKNEDTTTSELPTELSVPHEDIAQLEWLSNFVEDSFSAGSIIEKESPLIGGNVIKENSCNNDKEIKETHEFQTPSPTSVLETSSSCSVSNGSSSGFRTMPLSPITFVPGRARSKRPRPAYFKPRINIPIISPSSSCGSEEELYPYSSFESALEIENYVESPPVKKIHFKPIGLPSVTEMDNHPKQQEKKKKKKKLLLPPPSPTSSGSGSATDQLPHPGTTVRKCLHCEITKTPQWRAGPLGPKTLCNACGVRYKSGRLFPEYRPAASPTFVPSLHSNSHKKVLEMRTSVAHEASSSSATTDTSELVPNNNPMLASI